ncbi:MAG: hypothetical protein K8F52_04850 [Candidatus Scalindua rubra]|uniref:CRISPR associated protein Cas6 C-terminal domain-containing protein n=1 Tax=Candidatus Scalindua brodae TaxID=237368 RepID=A0A0B0EC56_9BACT|nr:MAG: hypothetical protein SCABRO_03430 [Candidatus Scalindua brodae]MBZ0107975.1 hypothetical protein [Candidatus Scalindua rubra]
MKIPERNGKRIIKRAVHTILKLNLCRLKYCRERIRDFKGTVIKGWTGHFRLEGKPELLQFALDTGLGSRNSAGFGFIEKVGKR